MLGVVDAWIQAGIISKIKLYSKLLIPRKVIGGVSDGLSCIFSCCFSASIVQLTFTTLKKIYCILIIILN